MSKFTNLKINGIELKKIKKTGQKLIKNKYFTYVVALFTLFFVSETLCNPDNELLLGIKNLFNNNIIKFIFLICAVLIGYYNQTLGILLVINFFFLINIQEKIEFFANQLPDLINKNEVLKYNKYFKKKNDDKESKSNSPSPSKKKVELENTSEEDVRTEEEDTSDKIKNPILIQKSRELESNKISLEKEKEIEDSVEKEVEEVLKKQDKDFEDKLSELDPVKRKLYEKYYKLHKNNKKKQKDNLYFSSQDDENIKNKKSLREHELRKKKNLKNKEVLIDELKKIEEEEYEENNENQELDETLESEIKNKKLEQRKNLELLEDSDEDSSSSDSSNSSSSESSSDSEQEYNDISLSEARDHVLKKIRNRMKKEYATDT